MSWGYRIMFLYIGFVTLIMTLVFKSMNQKVDLVTNDYYEQELKYQEKIDAIENAQKLSSSVNINQVDSDIFIHYPEEFKVSGITGRIIFFRPSDSSLDVAFNLIPGENLMQKISTEKIQKGYYNVQVEWENSEGKKYYSEQTINIK